MCQTVYYMYGCGHTDRTIFRCSRTPNITSTGDQIYACAERVAASHGSWTTSLGEDCHNCFENDRQLRRPCRHNSRGLPGNLALTQTTPNRADSVAAQENTLSPQQQQESATRDARAHAPRLMRRQRPQPLQQGLHEQQLLFRGRGENRMAFARHRSPDGVIRPLESNLLENIRRETCDGFLTPAQMLRFWDA